MFGVFIVFSYWQVGEYSSEELDAALTFTYATDNPNEPLKADEIFIYGKKISSATTTSKKIQAELTLPTSLGHITGNNETRISFIMYRTTSLFPSRSLNKANKDQVKFNQIPNTRIISATTYGVDATNLSEPVNTTYAAAQTEDDKVLFCFEPVLLSITINIPPT